jgi:MFS family permease
MAVYSVMPTAVRDLNGMGAYAWAFTGVALAAIVATVVGGDVSDRRGPRLPLVGGLALFVVGLVVCSLAPSMHVFVAGRILQGLGGGAAIVAVYVVVARVFPAPLRPQVFSAMAAAWVVPALVGPAIAGAITAAWGWRWVFVAVLPVVVAATWAVGPTVRAVDGPAPERGAEGTYVSADRSGRTRTAVVLALGAVLIQDGARRSGPTGALEAVAGLGVLAWSLRSLLPVGALRLRPGLPAGVSARGLVAGAFFGTEAFVPLMLTDEHGFGVTAAGLALTASAVGWFAGSWLQGRPGLGIPRERLVVGGTVLTIVGIVGMIATVVGPLPFVGATVAWTIGGFGMGMTIPSVNVRVLSLSPPAELGANSAALQVADGVGILVCTSLAGAIYGATTAPPGDQAGAFVALYAAMAAVAVAALVAARRLDSVAAPPEAPGSGRPVPPPAAAEEAGVPPTVA